MGIRRNCLVTLTSLLDKLVVGEDPNGNDILLTAVTRLFDPNAQTKELPKISIVPLPETVQTGLMGMYRDSTFRIGIFGYCYASDSEGNEGSALLFAEDIIEEIQKELVDETNTATMLGVDGQGFSIVEIGPCLNEQLDDVCNLAYFSVPIAVQFVQD